MKLLKLSRNCVLLAIAFVFIAFAEVNATKLHTIVVIQTSAPGTTMDDIRFREQSAEIARMTGMELEEHYFLRNQTDEIRETVDNLTCSSDDVIWFYYSGHGRNSGDGWPAFSAKTKQSEIHDILKSKGARLVVTTYDCCNGGATTMRNNVIGSPVVAYTLLFKNSTGDIKSCSSSDGLPSYGYPNTGGFFSSSFFESFNDVSASSDEEQKDIWKNVAILTDKETKKKCAQYNREPDLDHQNPKFEIRVETTPMGRVPNAPDFIEAGKKQFSDLKTVRDIIDIYKGTSNHENLDLALLKKLNDGQKTYAEGNEIKTTIKITSLDQKLEKGQVVWLIEPW